MVTLEEWSETSAKDYGVGLALLNKLSKNRILLQNLSRRKNQGKLEYELKKYAKKAYEKVFLNQYNDTACWYHCAFHCF